MLQTFLESSVEDLVGEFVRHKEFPQHQAKATFQFLTDLASGVVPTTSTRIREFVQRHEQYQQDSVVNEVELG